MNRELFSMDDVKVEVMRARGAGGQVGSFHPTSSFLFHNLTRAHSM